MNPESVDYHRRSWAAEQRRYSLCLEILNKLADKLGDDVYFSPSVYIVITVKTREDLSALMTLAPKWTKTPDESGIVYRAEVDGEEIQIKAIEAALPGTCKLVEEEYEVPETPAKEAVPARKATRMVLKCDHATEVSA